MPSNYEFEGFRSTDTEKDELADYVLQGDAHRDQRVGFSRSYIVEASDGRLIGYFSLMADTIKLSRGEQTVGVPYFSAPALKIARLAVSVEFQGRGIGNELLAYVKGLAQDLRRAIGVRYLSLDSVEDKVGWYSARGFVLNSEASDSYEGDHETGERSMRFDLGPLLDEA
jgi:ribosomal protein S18 acetylase RimI-like enzyme